MTLYDLIDRAMITQQVMADGRLAPLLAPSRRAPMRSAVKRYGTFLDLNPETTPAERYHRPAHEIKAFIQAKAPLSLAANTRRNLANDVIALLRIGVDQGWLDPLPEPLLSWRERRPDPWHSGVKRGEWKPQVGYYGLSLEACPPAFREELWRYLQWCAAPVARNRPSVVVKRPITNQGHQGGMLRLAGFATRELHMPADQLTLAALCQLDVLEAFVNWWMARRGQVTLSLRNALIYPETIARYWLKDEPLADAIRQMINSLPPSMAVRQKEERWLSLHQLEEIGQSIYPLNARRLREYPGAGRPNPRNSGRRVSWYVEMSLLLRLLIRLPMRQRNLREMQLGKNLYQDQQGIWQIRFVGTELKIDTIRGTLNRYEFPFPADLVPLLEEWLREWRPRLAALDESHVFLTSRGHVMPDTDTLARAVGTITYRFTGVTVYPHLIRDIWATEYLNATGDVAGCARRLGNTVGVVMQHYAHILKKDADARAEAFMRGAFANGNGT
jgi:integrase